MTLQTQSIGVPSIQYPVFSSTTIPALTTLSWGASAITPLDTPLLNDANQSLLTTDSYNFIIGLVATDPIYGGYSVTQCSPVRGPITITSGQVIELFVNNVSWPANFTGAVCVAIFMQINAANYQLYDFSYLPPNSNFSTLVTNKPLYVAPTFTQAVLQSTGADPANILGSRSNLTGFTYQTITPTTGVFNFRRAVSNVTVSPNTSGDYQVATTRSPSIQFQALQNDMRTVVQATAGTYGHWTSVFDSTILREARKSLFTAQAILTGNKPIQIVLPIDSNKNIETRLLIGQLTANQQEIEEAWSKTAPTPITFRFDAAAQDQLITNTHTEISWLRGS